jgi:mono/diheme cytochrome c family protein
MKRTTVKRPGPVVGAALALALAFGVAAHVVQEAPWHPVPAAYLRSLFYLNLKPVPWDLIAGEYGAPVREAGYRDQTVYDLLAPLAGSTGVDYRAQLSAAIAARDSATFYELSTRAVSQLVRHHLQAAWELLDEPGAAHREVLRAEAVCRAFYEGAIEAGDPEAYERLGQAWLALSTSAGARGVLGLGGAPADRPRFAAARQVVEGYLLAGYESELLAVAPPFAPVPAQAPEPAAAALRFARLLPPGANLNDQDPLPLLRLNFEARGIDEADLFLVAYGDMLFDSAAILGEPARSLGMTCSTCHNRSDINRDLFIPGISHQPGAVDVDAHFFNERFNDHRADSLDIPSLRGLRFTAPYGRDGRFASLRDFTRNVIVNEFRGPEPTPLMLDALVAYMFEFDWLPAPYLRPDGTLSTAAPEAARRGEALFRRPFAGLGGRSCATCHVPSANFIDRQVHDIGSGDATEPGARDTFFDTPTLINAVYTAPYFHDGSLPTLRAVVEWFDEHHQLELAAEQVADLTAYLEAVGATEEPYQRFDAENTPFALAWDELSTFLSTLETLLPARDRQHALVLLDTVAPDLRADVVGAWEPSAIAGQVYEIADVLDGLRSAVAAERWDEAHALHLRYKELADAYGPRFR